MVLTNQKRLKNRLLNRVRRHTRLATIFQSADPIVENEIPALGSLSQSPGETLWDDTLVEATPFLLPDESPPIFQDRPLSTITRRPSSPESAIKLAINRAEKLTAPNTKSNQPDSPTTSPPEVEKIDENLWHKLKRISRMHRVADKEQNLDKTTTTSIQKIPEIPMEPKGKGKSRQNESDGYVEQVDESSTRDMDLEGESDIKTRSVAILENRQADRHNKDHIVDIDDVKVNEKGTQNSTKQRDPTDMRLSKINDPQEKMEAIGGPETEMNRALRPDEDNMLPGSVEDIEKKPQLHSVPLEAVWPVQKKAVEPDQIDKPEENTTHPGTKAVTATPPTHIGLDDQVETESIQNILRHVIPHQPTSSSIELITPSKPRPESRNMALNAEIGKTTETPHPKSHTAFPESTTIQTLFSPEMFSEEEDQNQSSEGSFQEEYFHDQQPCKEPDLPGKKISSSLKSIKIKPPSQMDITRDEPSFPGLRSDSKVINETEQKPDSKLVHTDIGPLPADLWTILKQKSPTSGEINDVQDQSSQPRQESDLSPLKLGEAKERESFSEKPSTQGIPDITPPTIQRTVSQVGAISADASPTERSGESHQEGEPSQLAEADIDELSRRVYAEIRRQLVVEWERSRNRY